MHVIAKRSILFYDEKQTQDDKVKAPRQHLVPFSRDVQQVPDWLADQEAFQNATKSGEIMVVQVASPEKPKPLAEVAQVLDLSKMSKDELIVHASEVHGLELDKGLKKDEMIAAIEEAKAT